jgi:hypothetical protein
LWQVRVGDYMDNMNKHKSREFDWHPRRNWLRRYINDLRKFYFQ